MFGVAVRNQFVAARKDKMLEQTTETVMGQLDEIADQIEAQLGNAIDDVLVVVQANFSLLSVLSFTPLERI